MGKRYCDWRCKQYWRRAGRPGFPGTAEPPAQTTTLPRCIDCRALLFATPGKRCKPCRVYRHLAQKRRQEARAQKIHLRRMTVYELLEKPRLRVPSELLPVVD